MVDFKVMHAFLNRFCFINGSACGCVRQDCSKFLSAEPCNHVPRTFQIIVDFPGNGIEAVVPFGLAVGIIVQLEKVDIKNDK